MLGDPGKSTLLVAILHLLLRQRAKAGRPLAGGRVLVSAHTNVAVDRVLLGEWPLLDIMSQCVSALHDAGL